MTAVSVVLPTRDRPAFVRQALRSLVAQRFEDFEVIVADNAVAAECRDVVDSFGDPRFRYLRTPRPLAMHDNWEWACEAASGDFVAVMIDKTLWLPSTLRIAMGIAHGSAVSVDAVCWWDSVFKLEDEDRALDRGEYHPHPSSPRAPELVDPREQLQRSMSFDVRRGHEGPEYYRGKICFGLYRRDLLELIRARWGRVFPPISPDYSSRAFALASATTVVDAGIPLQLSLVSRTSNGARVARDPQWALSFLDEIDPALVDKLPIPGLYGSAHNMVAHDYELVASGGLEIDRRHLTLRAREDLALAERWPSETIRRRQYELLRAAERRAGIRLSVRWWRSVEPSFRRAASAVRVEWSARSSRLIGRLPKRVKELGRALLGSRAPARATLSDSNAASSASIGVDRAIELAEAEAAADPTRQAGSPLLTRR